MQGKISMNLSFCQSEQEFSLDELVLRILEPLSSPCRAWRKDGQTVSSGYECPGQRDFISWWSAPWLSTRTSGGVSVRNLLLPQFNTCSSSGVSDRLLVKKSFDLLRLFLNASHMGFGMFFKLPIPFCRRSFGKGRFQIPVQ